MASHRAVARNAETSINEEVMSKIVGDHSPGIQIKIMMPNVAFGMAWGSTINCDSGCGDREAGTVLHVFGTDGVSGSHVIHLSGAAVIAVLASRSSCVNSSITRGQWFLFGPWPRVELWILFLVVWPQACSMTLWNKMRPNTLYTHTQFIFYISYTYFKMF